jgi:bifunctional enzyme CysN/CysC
LTLADEIDVSRGDLLVRSDDLPQVGSRVLAHVVWMTESPLLSGRQYTIKHNTRTVTGSVSKFVHRIDVNTQAQHPANQLNLNEIGLLELSLAAPIALDPYKKCKGTGSFIVIDRLTNVTIGAGMIQGISEGGQQEGPVTPEERAQRFAQKGETLWLKGSKAQAVAQQLERKLFNAGHVVVILENPADAATLSALSDAGILTLCLAAPYAGVAENTAIDADASSVETLYAQLKQQGILLS